LSLGGKIWRWLLLSVQPPKMAGNGFGKCVERGSRTDLLISQSAYFPRAGKRFYIRQKAGNFLALSVVRCCKLDKKREIFESDSKAGTSFFFELKIQNIKS